VQPPQIQNHITDFIDGYWTFISDKNLRFPNASQETEQSADVDLSTASSKTRGATSSTSRGMGEGSSEQRTTERVLAGLENELRFRVTQKLVNKK
jgi:hypothetical protein